MEVYYTVTVVATLQVLIFGSLDQDCQQKKNIILFLKQNVIPKLTCCAKSFFPVKFLSLFFHEERERERDQQPCELSLKPCLALPCLPTFLSPPPQTGPTPPLILFSSSLFCPPPDLHMYEREERRNVDGWSRSLGYVGGRVWEPHVLHRCRGSIQASR